MFFRRDALEEIGGFDEQFFLYFEETDWCLRATKNGKKIHFLPWITAVHIGGTSTRPNYLDHLMIYVQSAVRFYRKHSGPHIAKLMKIAVRTVAAFNLMRWTLSVKMKPENHQSQNDWVEISRKTAIGRW